MPKLKIEVPTNISADVAMEKTNTTLQEFMEIVHAKDLEVETNGYKRSFKCSSLGFKFNGSVLIEDNRAVAEIEMPFAAMMFKDKIEKAVRKSLLNAIEK